MAYEDVVTWLATQVEAVTDIGQVHTTEPRAETIKEAFEKFGKDATKGDVVCVWFIGHGPFSEDWKTNVQTFADEGTRLRRLSGS